MLLRCSIQKHSSCCNSKEGQRILGAYAGIGRKTEFCGACFDCRRKGEQESRFLKNEDKVRTCQVYVRRSCSTAVKNILDYNTRNGKFKRLEPHFQLSATRSASKEGTETAVALSHSRECTKEPITALLNYGSKEKFGARAELRNVL